MSHRVAHSSFAVSTVVGCIALGAVVALGAGCACQPGQTACAVGNGTLRFIAGAASGFGDGLSEAQRNRPPVPPVQAVQPPRNCQTQCWDLGNSNVSCQTTCL